MGDVRDEMVQMIARDVAAADVDLTIRVYPGQSLFKAADQWSAIVRGQLDITALPSDDARRRPPKRNGGAAVKRVESVAARAAHIEDDPRARGIIERHSGGAPAPFAGKRGQLLRGLALGRERRQEFCLPFRRDFLSGHLLHGFGHLFGRLSPAIYCLSNQHRLLLHMIGYATKYYHPLVYFQSTPAHFLMKLFYYHLFFCQCLYSTIHQSNHFY